MDRRHESGSTGRTAAARHGEVDADARAGEQAAPSVSAVSGPASRDTTATDGAERRVVGGIDSDREGGRFRVRLFVPSWRRRTTREVLAAVDTEREPRLTTQPNTPERCRSWLTSPTPVARCTSRSATQARDLTRQKRRSARGSRTCATASPPSAARSRLTRRRRAERGCMAAFRTPDGDNRCSTRGPFGLSSSESASRTIIAVRRATPSRLAVWIGRVGDVRRRGDGPDRRRADSL